jgi:hypothetical protein
MIALVKSEFREVAAIWRDSLLVFMLNLSGEFPDPEITDSRDGRSAMQVRRTEGPIDSGEE